MRTNTPHVLEPLVVALHSTQLTQVTCPLPALCPNALQIGGDFQALIADNPSMATTVFNYLTVPNQALTVADLLAATAAQTPLINLGGENLTVTEVE